MHTIATDVRLLAPAEVAERLGVSRGTVYRCINAGELPAVRLGHGGTLRVSDSTLETWLEPTAARR
jgi:excisionase family DNA binding protein